MRKKKPYFLLILLITFAIMMTGCDKNTPETPVEGTNIPTDTPASEPATDSPDTAGELPAITEAAWKANPLQHWRVSQDGEKSDVGDHSFFLDEKLQTCTICDAIFKFSGETEQIEIYNASGDITYSASYHGRTLTSAYEKRYEFDNNGNVVVSSYYDDQTGTLLQRTTYTLDEKGTRLQSATYSGSDQTLSNTSEYLYNDKGQLIGRKLFDSAGKLYAESEYTVNSLGIPTILHQESMYDTQNITVDYDPYGNLISQQATSPNGSSYQKDEREYDPDGKLTTIRTYYGSDGSQTAFYEYHYSFTDSGRCHLASLKGYNAEGDTVLWESSMNEYGETVTAVYSDPSFPEHIRDEFEYDENGIRISTTSYSQREGELSKSTINQYDDPLCYETTDAEGNVLYGEYYEYEYADGRISTRTSKIVHDNVVTTEEIDRYQYVLDDAGEVTKTLVTSFDMQETKTGYHEEDKDGNRLWNVSYAPDGSVAEYNEYKTLSNGNEICIRSISFYSGGMSQYIYNRNGNLVTSMTYDANSDVTGVDEFDSSGNYTGYTKYDGNIIEIPEFCK